MRSIAIDASGQFVVAASLHGFVRAWDLSERSGQCRVIFGLKDHTQAVAISRDGEKAVSGCADGRLCLWNPRTGDCAAIWHGHAGSVRAIAISEDGKLAASASKDETIHVWDLSTIAAIPTTETDEASVWCQLRTDRALKDTANGAEPIVRMWKPAVSTAAVEPQRHLDSVECVAITGDGLRAVSGSRDNTVRVWDVHRGACTAVLRGHTETVLSVVMGPNGQFAVSASVDKSIRIWNLERGLCMYMLEGHEGAVDSLAIRRDGAVLASASEHDRTVRVWDLSSKKCIATHHLDPFDTENAELAWHAVDPDAPFLSTTVYGSYLTLFDDIECDELVACFFGDFKCFARSSDKRFGIAGDRTGREFLFRWKVNPKNSKA